MIKKTKKNDAVYICGIPTCHRRLVLPNRGDAVKIPHRDLHGFICNGLLILWDLTKEGREHKMRMAATVNARQKRDRMKRPDPQSDGWRNR